MDTCFSIFLFYFILFIYYFENFDQNVILWEKGLVWYFFVNIFKIKSKKKVNPSPSFV